MAMAEAQVKRAVSHDCGGTMVINLLTDPGIILSQLVLLDEMVTEADPERLGERVGR